MTPFIIYIFAANRSVPMMRVLPDVDIQQALALCERALAGEEHATCIELRRDDKLIGVVERNVIGVVERNDS